MKLTNKVLKLIDTPVTRIRLASALRCTEQTIMRYIKVNSDNLTKAASLEVIKKETGLTEEQILEPETEKA